ncbi:MAG: 4-(cytidine 5'-diphospho)-2-C-methyl-D-erythritol kinase [SAR202 cluster bacterium]|jgi:4-diphosphocytidyl-2-C-methyl-D-erythritol kinase|nr:4-(cytidine 5'-diphospho)-2-C-methyl-D-erythritol kinase [Chloroflexota bacterium]MDP6420222.1 4-(cytidine 5'-diphospho)-2-C-methyl-D-erythritol kinase [SAR202 cluster bacterium]HAL46312.1 4-(cytidine 5'-diphospho)-2-C-methyl-D-erythritol kinase [Dehalococcoidia bacterium]MDP6664939.1 4-(cytidine 5'-diphospho)-2-C-methyl-D-erythritol kinase [SAR202 cluster bacterium]MDP6798693.1 4-(cytidine 5'-diphospho)-2-C-methyl-D-erythritol kinase [SAR202 cluster bacterium]|tara:strand:- start:7314 stop:8189 length:876 start_codon:yes stop_codon:yes gene_type:complete
MISVEAHAKINLTLEVQGRRPDGFHEIASIVQTISLHDVVTIHSSESLTLSCDIEGLAPEENLAFKAASMLRQRSGTTTGARIEIEKHIPVAAGLGGGSSDAAATLTVLNQLWELDIDAPELEAIAAELGSDIPYLLRGGTAMLSGRGERVRTLPAADLPWIVLFTPKAAIDNKTATMYGAVEPSDYTRGALTRKLDARIRGGGDVPPQFLFNVFDEVAKRAVPGLSDQWAMFESLGAREVHLSGSGPTMYSPVAKREFGSAMQLLLTHTHGQQAHLVTAWDPERGEHWTH